MSTPSPQPLDYDLVSPYAPKHARDPISPPPPPPPPPDEPPALTAKPRPAAIESDNDARILDEIEASLRAMIAAEHSPPKQNPTLEEPAPQGDADAFAPERDPLPDEAATPTIDSLEASALADDRHSQERRYYDAVRVHEVLQQVSQQLTKRDPQEPAREQATPEQPEQDPDLPPEEYRLPPAFLARPMEPIRFDEPDDQPWPKVRSKDQSKPRSSALTLFVRFGFAAGGAAAVMVFAIPEIRARFMDAVGTPLASLSSNAAAVFGEGRPATARIEPARNEPLGPIAIRTEPVVLTREPDRFGAAMPKLATADLSPVMPEQRIAANIGNAPMPQRETVMVPMTQRAAPEQPARPQTIWHGPPGRAEGEGPATSGMATRPLAAEEIELLRKMGNDFIAAGDFAGARGVLERAAEAGDASSALALAATYDPTTLARFKVRGLVPDNAKAAFWYERARDLGSQEAPVRLKALARSN